MLGSRELWASIPGYEDIYEASLLGQVRRVVDAVQARSYAGRILKPINQHTGYQTVSLYRDKIPTILLIHRIICETFIGPCPEGLQVNHKDGDKTNNKLENLEYVTRKQNCAHASEAGLYQTGEDHHAAKLTEEDVLEIVISLEEGESQYSVAARYGITQANVSMIWCGNTWGRVTGIKRSY